MSLSSVTSLNAFPEAKPGDWITVSGRYAINDNRLSFSDMTAVGYYRPETAFGLKQAPLPPDQINSPEIAPYQKALGEPFNKVEYEFKLIGQDTLILCVMKGSEVVKHPGCREYGRIGTRVIY